MAPKASGEKIVFITKQAAAQFKKAVTRERAGKDAGLRILLVSGGGGYRYDMQFETKAQEGDTAYTQNGVKMYFDATASQHLKGTVLDFVEAHGGFIFHRPDSQEAQALLAQGA